MIQTHHDGKYVVGNDVRHVLILEHACDVTSLFG